MKPEKQCVAIAKVVGWKPTTDGGICWDRAGKAIVTPPDYPNDLNEMHEAEKVLSEAELTVYRENLAKNFKYRSGYKWSAGHKQAIQSTAAQRAEAFLRTLGKWEDDK